MAAQTISKHKKIRGQLHLGTTSNTCLTKMGNDKNKLICLNIIGEDLINN